MFILLVLGGWIISIIERPSRAKIHNSKFVKIKKKAFAFIEFDWLRRWVGRLGSRTTKTDEIIMLLERMTKPVPIQTPIHSIIKCSPNLFPLSTRKHKHSIVSESVRNLVPIRHKEMTHLFRCADTESLCPLKHFLTSRIWLARRHHTDQFELATIEGQGAREVSVKQVILHKITHPSRIARISQGNDSHAAKTIPDLKESNKRKHLNLLSSCLLYQAVIAWCIFTMKIHHTKT